ncbi:hypothetical protein [Thaumasiovibrio subtropicus]|uniref:hypothetical protein n=1 Tax=Thaumasiovibrio subtropicus TaxID=1891207 RepID=UPI000B35A577|nr:hypothetical protein [Thaumasiovibrio subtropicus]
MGIRGTLEDTTIVAKKPLGGFYWYDVSLTRCKFVGKFHNNCFGSRNGSPGLVEQCDFSQADIDRCFFFGSNVESNTFPKWPFLFLFNSRENVSKLEQYAKENENVAYIFSHSKHFGEEVKGICYDARKLAKLFNTTVDDIKHSFSGFDFIKF